MNSIICQLLLCINTLLCVSSTIPYKDVTQIVFDDASNYTSLLVHDDYLYVGCLDSNDEGTLHKRDASDISSSVGVASLTLSPADYYMKNIMQNDDKLYVCGSNSANPKLYEINLSGFSLVEESNGVYKCPLRSDYFAAAVFDSGGALFSAAQYENLGASGISRSPTAIGTPDLHTVVEDKWIYQSPDFFEAYHIPSTEEIYIFFLETAYENPNQFAEKYPRVGKVCTQDTGGSSNVLTNEFTSYQKARLSCEFEGTTYNILQSIDKLGSDGDEVFYGIFLRDMNDNSIVCSYHVNDIIAVFSSQSYSNLPAAGKLWEEEITTLDPYPGECVVDSSVIPEATLNALESHPLMWGMVPSRELEPLLTSLGTKKRFTKILASEVTDISGTLSHTVLYIGTDQGSVIKVLYGDADAYIITEFIVDDEKRAISVMTMSDSYLYIAFDDKVIQVPVQYCDRHTDCYSCVAARDPHCSWDTSSEACIQVVAGDTSNLRQDVAGGSPANCEPKFPNEIFTVTEKKVGLDGIGLADCTVSDAMWMKDDVNITLDGAKYVSLNGNGLLLVTHFKKSDDGVYSCYIPGYDEALEKTRLTAIDQTICTNEPRIASPYQGPSNITYPGNSTVYLYCVIYGPIGTVYSWVKDGDDVDEEDSVVLLGDCNTNNETKRMTWVKATVPDDGTQKYTCKINGVTEKEFEIKSEDIEDAAIRKESMYWEIEYYEHLNNITIWHQGAQDCTDGSGAVEIDTCEEYGYCLP